MPEKPFNPKEVEQFAKQMLEEDWENRNVLDALQNSQLCLRPFDSFTLEQLNQIIKNTKLKKNLPAILGRMTRQKFLGKDEETGEYWMTTEGVLYDDEEE